MAISRIQQSQVSGSLAHSSVEVTGSDLIGQSSLNADLDVLRSLIKDMKGSSGNWYDVASQDLAEIYGAFQASGANSMLMGDAAVVGSITGSSSLTIAGPSGLVGAVTAGSTVTAAGLVTANNGLTVNNAAADFNAGVTANEIKIDGDASWPGRFYIVGSSGEIADASELSLVDGHFNFTGSAGFTSYVNVAGALSVSGAGLFASDVNVVGDLTGSSGLLVQGAADLDGALDVAGAVTMQDALTVAGAATLNSSLDVVGLASLDGGIDVDGAFAVAGDGSGDVSTSGTLAVLGNATFSSITGSAGLKIDGDADFNSYSNFQGGVIMNSTLTVGGATSLQSTLGVNGAATFNSTLQAGASTLASLNVSGNATFSSITGSAGLKIDGDADFNGGVAANEIKIDGDTPQRLYIVGASGEISDEQYLTYDGSTLKIDASGGQGGLWVTGDAQVDGDLRVKGAFTYIETQNLAVKDSFIYLATGSAGSSDSGIVFSKGAGGSWDLILGQDSGAGEVIFAKQSHNASVDSPASLDNAVLVPAWMSEIKLGLNEGELSGSLAAVAGDGVSLTSSGPILFSALGEAGLAFNGSGNTAPVGFNDSSSMMAMFNELRAGLSSVAAGGSNQKESYGIADFTGNVLSFTNSQSISSGDHDLLDVYLNGVLMAPGRDLTAISTSSVTFDASIVSSLIADDVIVVISRG
jgi:hypothetical protein